MTLPMIAHTWLNGVDLVAFAAIGSMLLFLLGGLMLHVPQTWGRFGAVAQHLAAPLTIFSMAVLTAALAFSPAAGITMPRSGAMMVISGLAIALLLFVLRLTHKLLYGIIELLVGAAMLLLVAKRVTADDFLAVGLGYVGAVYVLIRGLTNIYDAGIESGRVMRRP